MTNIAFPYAIGSSGMTMTAPRDEHIRELIELVLMTNAASRVNRPTFGAGLMQLVFAPASAELATTMESVINAELMQWLGALITVNSVVVTADFNEIRIDISYVVLDTNQPSSVTLLLPSEPV